ncbi:MAG: Hsp20/alpha crystallin family protein [Phycisphaerales bacterium]|nr:MAG: Hsp20/alpha crystallin family protein [Phycisphaerales bacterium]
MATEDTAIEKKGTGEVTRREHTRSGLHYRPNVDILESQDELTLLADLPGVKAEDVDIHFERGTLTLHGKVRPRQADKTNYLLREYGVGDFYRTFEVSESIDPSRIHAELKDGVLMLHLPKVEAAKPRKIEVKPQQGT